MSSQFKIGSLVRFRKDCWVFIHDNLYVAADDGSTILSNEVRECIGELYKPYYDEEKPPTAWYVWFPQVQKTIGLYASDLTKI